MKEKAFKIILIILLCTVVPQLPVMVVRFANRSMVIADFLSALVINYAFLVVTGVVQPLLHLHRAGKLPCLQGLL